MEITNTKYYLEIVDIRNNKSEQLCITRKNVYNSTTNIAYFGYGKSVYKSDA